LQVAVRGRLGPGTVLTPLEGGSSTIDPLDLDSAAALSPGQETGAATPAAAKAGRLGAADAEIAVVGASPRGITIAAGFAAQGYTVWVVEPSPDLRQDLGARRWPGTAREARILTQAAARGRVKLAAAPRDAAARAAFIYMSMEDDAAPGSGSATAQLETAVEDLAGATPQGRPVIVVGGDLGFDRHAWLDDKLGHLYDVVSGQDLPDSGRPGALRPEPQPVLIGTDDAAVAERLRALYRAANAELVIAGRREAEVAGPITNALLAARLSAANEVATLCEALGIDGNQVLELAGLDPRLGPDYMVPGIGFGGKHLPRDLAAVVTLAESARTDAPVLRAAIARNRRQRDAFVERVLTALGSPVGRRVGVWGLTYKGDSEVLEESPAFSIAQAIAAINARVSAYDPAYADRGGELLQSTVPLVGNLESAARDAEVLIVLTDWPEFRTVDWDRIAGLMAGTEVIDGRNCLDGAAVREAGLDLQCVGMGKGSAGSTSVGLTSAWIDTLAVVPPEVVEPDATGEAAAGTVSPLADGRSFLAALPASTVDGAGPAGRRQASTSRVYLGLKRLLDFSVGAVALVLGAPLMALIAIALWLESGRPVIFTAERVGKGGRLFRMYKFRTMHPDTPKYGHKSANNPWVTRVGRLLRITNLDELPQAWNLVNGDMSLVGPRPEQPFIVEWYQPWQAERLQVPPGITGWWQIHMRGKDLMYQHIEYDVWYTRHRSLWLDLEILFKTPFALLRGQETR
jgi:UDPglucose 6-dehydrogenase